jgi:tetratricopeptide (TPR) repeat protein
VIERYLLDGDSRLAGVTDAERSAALLAGAILCTRQGDSARTDQLRRALEKMETMPAALARLRRIWANEGDSKTDDPPALSNDVSERITSYFGSGAFPRESRTGDEPAFSLTRVEKLLGFVSSLAASPTEDTVELGRGCEDVDSSIAEVLLDLDKTLGRTGAVSPIWLTRAREAQDEKARRHAYERLAELDEQNGDQSSALLWHKTLSEEFPQHVPTLLRLEETGFSLGQPSNHAAEMLARSLPPGDRETYQLVGGSMALVQSDLRRAQKYLEPLLDAEKPTLLALRGLVTVAQERRDEQLLLRTLSAAFEYARTDLDKAAGALGVALVHARLAQNDDAIEWVKRSITARPDAFAAHLLLNQLESPSDGLERAEQLEAFARAARTASHRTELWFAAGTAWDEAEDPLRAADCYDQTLVASPDHKEAFTRLCERREAQGATDTLIELLSKRLELVSTGGAEHLELELKLSSLFMTQERPEEAKSHLETALASHPGHAGALRAHAEVSAALGAHDSAVKSLVALRDRLEPGDERVAVERSLGKLYEQHLGQLEKAMDAYQAVYEARSGDEEIRADLVRVYCGLGLADRATSLLT